MWSKNPFSTTVHSTPPSWVLDRLGNAVRLRRRKIRQWIPCRLQQYQTFHGCQLVTFGGRQSHYRHCRISQWRWIHWECNLFPHIHHSMGYQRLGSITWVALQICSLSRWYPLSTAAPITDFSVPVTTSAGTSFLFVGAIVGLCGWHWGFRQVQQ